MSSQVQTSTASHQDIIVRLDRSGTHLLFLLPRCLASGKRAGIARLQLLDGALDLRHQKRVAVCVKGGGTAGAASAASTACSADLLTVSIASEYEKAADMKQCDITVVCQSKGS